jgi:hypothetical protein
VHLQALPYNKIDDLSSTIPEQFLFLTINSEPDRSSKSTCAVNQALYTPI